MSIDLKPPSIDVGIRRITACVKATTALNRVYVRTLYRYIEQLLTYFIVKIKTKIEDKPQCMLSTLISKIFNIYNDTIEPRINCKMQEYNASASIQRKDM